MNKYNPIYNKVIKQSKEDINNTLFNKIAISDPFLNKFYQEAQESLEYDDVRKLLMCGINKLHMVCVECKEFLSYPITCNLKICPFCQGKLRHRNFKKYLPYMDQFDNIRFMTLNLKNYKELKIEVYDDIRRYFKNFLKNLKRKGFIFRRGFYVFEETRYHNQYIFYKNFKTQYALRQGLKEKFKIKVQKTKIVLTPIGGTYYEPDVVIEMLGITNYLVCEFRKDTLWNVHLHIIYDAYFQLNKKSIPFRKYSSVSKDGFIRQSFLVKEWIKATKNLGRTVYIKSVKKMYEKYVKYCVAKGRTFMSFEEYSLSYCISYLNKNSSLNKISDLFKIHKIISRGSKRVRKMEKFGIKRDEYIKVEKEPQVCENCGSTTLVRYAIERLEIEDLQEQSNLEPSEYEEYAKSIQGKTIPIDEFKKLCNLTEKDIDYMLEIGLIFSTKKGEISSY